MKRKSRGSNSYKGLLKAVKTDSILTKFLPLYVCPSISSVNISEKASQYYHEIIFFFYSSVRCPQKNYVLSRWNEITKLLRGCGDSNLLSWRSLQQRQRERELFFVTEVLLISTILRTPISLCGHTRKLQVS